MMAENILIRILEKIICRLCTLVSSILSLRRLHFSNKFDSVYPFTGSTQRIPAHKYVLAVGSSVFYAMFYGGLKSEEEVQVPDVEPSAFLTLLR